MNNKTLSAVTMGLVLIALAAGLIAYYAIGSALLAAGLAILAIGVILAVAAMGYSSVPDRFGTSDKMYRLAGGLFVADVGVAPILAYLGADLLIIVAVFVIILAAIGISIALANNKGEE